ncbi:MAG: 16S/23S rRNA (cytidine-2'-O)-methyltransferase, partial [Chloroflexi bacterium]
AVRRIAECAASLGLQVAGLTVSPITGQSGNVEYLVWLQKGCHAARPLDAMLAELFP